MNRTLNACTVIILSIAAMLAPAGPATAAPGCPTNRMCLHDTATTGPFFEVEPADAPRNWCNQNITPITSYITNRTGYRWIVSTSNDCSANRGIIYPNSEGPMAAPWNNNVRGMYRTSSTTLVAGPALPAAIVGGQQ